MTPNMKRLIIISIICGVFALICYAVGVPQALTLLKEPVDIEVVREQLYIEKQQLQSTYTGITIDNLYGPFDEDVNYVTSTNKYGVKSTTKETTLSYLYQLPGDGRILQIDVQNVGTRDQLNAFAQDYLAYVKGESAQKPQPIEITGTFDRLYDDAAIESVILDAVPIPEEGFDASDEMVKAMLIYHKYDVDTMSEAEYKELAATYHEELKDPSAQRLTLMLALEYRFEADRFEGEPYMYYYVVLGGFILFCVMIAAFWIGHFTSKNTAKKQNLSLDGDAADGEAASHAYTSGASTFITGEAERVLAARKKEAKTGTTMVVMGVMLLGGGIYAATVTQMLGGTLIFVGLLVTLTALIRRGSLKANKEAIEKELAADFIIPGMTPQKLDAEMAAYKADGPIDLKDNIHITENFVVQRFEGAITVVNLNRVLWAGGVFVAQNAKNTEKGAMLYDGTGPVDVPTKEGYSRVRSGHVVAYYGADGEQLYYNSKKSDCQTITGDERATKVVLKALHESHPWIFMGREQMEWLKAGKRPQAVELWKQKRQEAQAEK